MTPHPHPPTTKKKKKVRSYLRHRSSQTNRSDFFKKVYIFKIKHKTIYFIPKLFVNEQITSFINVTLAQNIVRVK